MAGPLMAMVAVRGWAVVMVDAERLRVMEGLEIQVKLSGDL